MECQDFRAPYLLTLRVITVAAMHFRPFYLPYLGTANSYFLFLSPSIVDNVLVRRQSSAYTTPTTIAICHDHESNR